MLLRGVGRQAKAKLWLPRTVGGAVPTTRLRHAALAPRMELDSPHRPCRGARGAHVRAAKDAAAGRRAARRVHADTAL